MQKKHTNMQTMHIGMQKKHTACKPSRNQNYKIQIK
jgi:hypothetical protein